MQSADVDRARKAASERKWWARRPSPAVMLVLVAVLAIVGWAATRWAIQFGLHRRVAEDANRIARRIEGYRSETNLYPDAATWQRWVAGDGAASLLDPWQRPYLYGVDSRAFSISTHGADGRPGGWGVDEDLTFVFRYLNPRMALPRAEPARQPVER
jgi:hypothetical protein